MSEKKHNGVMMGEARCSKTLLRIFEDFIDWLKTECLAQYPYTLPLGKTKDSTNNIVDGNIAATHFRGRELFNWACVTQDWYTIGKEKGQKNMFMSVPEHVNDRISSSKEWGQIISSWETKAFTSD